MRAITAVVAGLLLVGCGLQTGTAGGHKAPPSPSGSSSSVPVSCVHLKTTPGRVISGLRTVSLTNADNHGSFCVLRGTGIFVFLHASTSVLWTPIQSSSAALSRRPSGVMSLVRGETGAFFEAAQVGTATLTSFEPRCTGPHPGKAGGRCPAPLRYAVIVHVLG